MSNTWGRHTFIGPYVSQRSSFFPGDTIIENTKQKTGYKPLTLFTLQIHVPFSPPFPGRGLPRWAQRRRPELIHGSLSLMMRGTASDKLILSDVKWLTELQQKASFGEAFNFTERLGIHCTSGDLKQQCLHWSVGLIVPWRRYQMLQNRWGGEGGVGWGEKT